MQTNLAQNAVQMCLDAGAGDARICVSSCEQNALSLYNRDVDKIHHALDQSLSLQLYVDGRYGTFSTNMLEENQLRSFIFEAVALTRLLEADECRHLPGADICYKGGGPDLMQLDPEASAVDTLAAKTLCNTMADCLSPLVDKGPLQLFELNFGSSLEQETMADSAGFLACSKASFFSMSASCSFLDVDGARPQSWWVDAGVNFAFLDARKCAMTAYERGLSSLGGKQISAGNYNVILENSVASKFVMAIMSSLSGNSLQQNNSFLLNSLGKKMFSSKLTIIDNPHKQGCFSARLYDSEGIATRYAEIVENGVVKQYFLNSYCADKMGMQPTIDSASVIEMLPCGFTQSCPSEVFGVDEQMLALGKGVLITGFNGGNYNPLTGDFSYGFEGFWFENGSKSYPIREMNISGNYIDVWNKLIAVGNDSLTFFANRIPSLSFENLSIA